MRTSDLLTVGEAYTRNELAERFTIKDANLRNGIFRPRGHDSVWLFVTEKKARDRTQYVDRLDGDHLYWQGQTTGMRDPWVINHQADGREVLLFYREHKTAYPGYGFRFEGSFRYVSHTGAGPASYVLERERAYSAEPPTVSPEVATARALVAEQAGRPRSQGFRVSSAARRAIEEHAMRLAIAHYTNDTIESGTWNIGNYTPTRDGTAPHSKELKGWVAAT